MNNYIEISHRLMKTKYQPVLITPRPWSEIEAFYVDLILGGWGLNDLLSLVKYVRQNDLDKKLFAYTSLDKLIITIYNPAEFNRESLHIQYDATKKLYVFKYYPLPYEPIEFERIYSGEVLLEKFQNLLGLLKW